MNHESRTFSRKKKAKLENFLKAKQSFLLFGPRQTGKSTLLEEIFAGLPKNKILRYYFMLPSERGRLEADPEIIRREVEALEASEPIFVFIDEIQKIPSVMDVLQFLIDRKKIVLAATGSSARKMKSLGTNWLPGRVRLEYLYPLTWAECELGTSFDRAEEVLRFGSLPGILAKNDPAAREQNLLDYTALYLEEEIRQEALTRNVPRFSQFLRLAALESGTAPNFSKIGSTIGLTHPTVHEYFQILEDTLIFHRLEAFGAKRDAVLRSSRYYFFDIGVRNASAKIGSAKGILTLQLGPLFEHFVILELFANFKHQLNSRLSYWRTKQGDEVDLVIEKDNRLIAIEIKATTSPKSDDLASLEEFCRKYKSDEAYLVCRIPRTQKIGKIWLLPWFELFNKI